MFTKHDLPRNGQPVAVHRERPHEDADQVAVLLGTLTGGDLRQGDRCALLDRHRDFAAGDTLHIGYPSIGWGDNKLFTPWELLYGGEKKIVDPPPDEDSCDQGHDTQDDVHA